MKFIHLMSTLNAPTNWLCRSGMHTSSSMDPNSKLGPHIDVELTNDELMEDNFRTHLLHFRPQQPETSFFYRNSMTREDVRKEQNMRFAKKAKGGKKDDKKDKKNPPGGGAGAASSSSRITGGSGNSSKQSSYRGHGASSSGGHRKHQGQSYRHSSQVYHWPKQYCPRLSEDEFLLLELGHGIFIVPLQWLESRITQLMRAVHYVITPGLSLFIRSEF